ncbi:unnamed protein product [Closterium sp. Naga37s-1]|nr:unnamed protein product [Closterium sp. Naga37s-1]
MASLAALDLAVNRLSGPIPPALATLPMLKVLVSTPLSLGLPVPRPIPSFYQAHQAPISPQHKICPLTILLPSVPPLLSLFLPHPAHQDLTTILNPISSFARLIFPPSCLCSPCSTSLAPSPIMPSLTFLNLASNTLSGPPTPLSHPLSLSQPPFLALVLLPIPALPDLLSCFPPCSIPVFPPTSHPLSHSIGPIPAFCQEGQLLSFLNLASNSLSGPPTPLSSPSCSDSLQFLSLPANSLSGPIPATISSFTKLKRLRLHKNNLTGAIPTGVSKMNQLQGLGLSYNRLSGEIPPDWPAGIRQVLLAGNGLSGAVPAALSRLKRGSFKPGNPNLCGKPLPACA